MNRLCLIAKCKFNAFNQEFKSLEFSDINKEKTDLIID